MDGSVKPEGIDLSYHNSFPAATFHRMMGKREFEASELGLTFYLDTLHEDDPPFVAIPVYPIRLFSHSAIYINTNKGIAQPKDLIGKKIGEFFLYGHAGTWSKGILQDHYGVPVDSYANYSGGVERPTPPLPGTSRSRRRTSGCSTSAPRRPWMRCSMRARSTHCSPPSCRRR